MENRYLLQINRQGIIKEISPETLAIMGLTESMVKDMPFESHLDPSSMERYNQELEALQSGEQQNGRLEAAIIGLDSIRRPVKIAFTRQSSDNISVAISPFIGRTTNIETHVTTLADPRHLLPISKRITAICRRSHQKKELLSNAMAVVSEATQAHCAAVIEWGGAVSDWPVAATTGGFDREFLKGVFRSSVIGRLARGDVIIKDATQDGSASDQSLILIPLMASETPEGIILLYTQQGYITITPEEQHSLGLLGEIIGLGLRTLVTTQNAPEDHYIRAADTEATIALGRLSAGLAHEINNSVTVLHNNTQQIYRDIRRFNKSPIIESMSKDSQLAVDTIRDLTDALKAFAPEESRGHEEVDLVRMIETVDSAVRFYGKRGINVGLSLPSRRPIFVRCRSHYLVRALFLIFVELVEAAMASGRILVVNMSLVPAKQNRMNLILSVSADKFNIPTILLSQLEKDGVFARLVIKAGAELSYNIDKETLSLTLGLPLISTAEIRRSTIPLPMHPNRPSRRGKVLIVDDEPAIIRSTRRILEQDHDILAASNGREALNIIENHHDIDTILLDVFMPEIDGIQVAEALKSRNSELADRIIFMTGGATNSDVSKYVTDNNLPILEKPVDLQTLKLFIENMTSQR